MSRHFACGSVLLQAVTTLGNTTVILSWDLCVQYKVLSPG